MFLGFAAGFAGLLLGGFESGIHAQGLPNAPAPVVASAPTGAQTNAPQPRIQFDNTIWDFGRMPAGEVFKHTFVFTNIGNSVLELTQVQPGCGCTTAGEWTRRVEPGQTGSIPIQFNSANFQGPIMKSVVVHSNDKKQPNTILQLKGTLWKVVEVTPQFVMINVMPDSLAASNVVQIVNNGEEQLVLSNPESNNPLFHANLITNRPGKEFQLIISAQPELMTNNIAQGQITMKTSLASTPVVAVTAWANIQPALNIAPPQIVLPAGPLKTPTVPQITVQNNASSLIQLSDLTVDLPGVGVEMEERVPGRTFIIKLSFPQNFALDAGKRGTLTARTTSTQKPLIKIPIAQVHPVVSVPPVPGSAQ
jgi:hypothetical protein